MLKRTMLTTLALMLMVALTTATLGYAGEPVPIGDLPEPVTNAIEERFSGAELLMAEMEVEDDMVEYEVTFRHEGLLYEGKFLEDGTMLELERK